MALLTALVLSDDDTFRTETSNTLRSGTVPVTILEDRTLPTAFQPDVVLVDGRDESHALAAIERVRASAPAVSIFMVAGAATPELILQSMRAGANEFLTWPPADTAFHEAIARTAARRSALAVARPRATTAAFIGAKGGAGTTTVAVNSAVEMARMSRRPTVIVDLKAGMGEVTLFLGVRGRYTVFDAIENLHRLDTDFLRELVVKHKSGLEILAGSDHFERPGSADSPGVEQILRLLTQQYEQVVIDAGNQLNGSTTAALYMADTIYLVTNPDVPSVRNAQRLLDRIGQLGACADRVRVLLNRASEPYPIPPDQIESALGRPIHHMFRSDYRTVSAALNSGVPLSMTGNTELAAEFDSFTRGMLGQAVEAPESARRSALGLQRLASIW
jgi:pilus assembly protein CpaE